MRLCVGIESENKKKREKETWRRYEKCQQRINLVCVVVV